MIEAQVDMPIVGVITLYVPLLTFSLRVHPEQLDYVDHVLVYFFYAILMLRYDWLHVFYGIHMVSWRPDGLHIRSS